MKTTEETPRHKYVMLIDDVELDNFINEKMIKTYLFSKDVYVTTSATGALEFLNNLSISSAEFPDICPEVIFIDLNMPVMDGFHFIHTFRKITEKRVKKPKLVVLTSSAAPTDRKKTEDISSEITFLVKPLTKEMLQTLA